MDILGWLSENYLLVSTVVLLGDKAVAMSATKADDLLWSSAKKIVKKLSGK